MRVCISLAALAAVSGQKNNWGGSSGGKTDMGDWSNNWGDKDDGDDWDMGDWSNLGDDWDWSNMDKDGDVNGWDWSKLDDDTNMGGGGGGGGWSSDDKPNSGGGGGGWNMDDKPNMGGGGGGGGMDMEDKEMTAEELEALQAVIDACSSECSNEVTNCESRGKEVPGCVMKAVFQGGMNACATCIHAEFGKDGEGMDMGGDKGDKGGMGGGMDKVVCAEESMACEESLGLDFSQMDMGEGEGGKGQGGKNHGGKNSDDGVWNSFYFCLIQQAHTMNDPECGAILTTDEETKKGGKIGRNCLDEANLCSLQAVDQGWTIEQMFSECLMPVVEAGTASDACMEAFADMNPFSRLEMKAEEQCPDEGDECMSMHGISDVYSVPEGKEWDLMDCIAARAKTSDCSDAIGKLRTAAQCAEEIDEDAEDAESKVNECAKGNKKDKCAEDHKDSGECDMSECKMNNKTGKCYSKHTKKDDDGSKSEKMEECMTKCASYEDECTMNPDLMEDDAEDMAGDEMKGDGSKGDGEQMNGKDKMMYKMIKCIHSQAPADSECGMCLDSMKDGMDQDGGKTVMVTMAMYNDENTCSKQKNEVSSEQSMKKMGCNTKEKTMEDGSVVTMSMSVSCEHKDGTVMLKHYSDNGNCDGEPDMMSRAMPNTECLAHGDMFAMATVVIPEMCKDEKVAELTQGSFPEFAIYCGKQTGEWGCNQCSGNFSNGVCTAPAKTSKVKCSRIENMDLCEKVGCNSSGKNCRGQPSFNDE